MNDKDLILSQMTSNPNREPGIFFTPESLQEVILTDRHVDEIELLIRQIIADKPELLKIENMRGIRLAVSPTGVVSSFLKNGGFNKIETERKEKLEAESKKSKIDLELAEKMLEEYPKTKWFSRIGFFIGVVLALKELYIWLMKLLSQ